MRSCACMRSNPSDMTVCCVAATRGATTHTGITGDESGCVKRENGPKEGESLLQYILEFYNGKTI